MTPPEIRPWAHGAVPVPTGSQAAGFDRDAIESGIPAELLMERAGVHAAELLVELWGPPRDRPALVVAGLGNNGGDGLVMARALAAWGCEVHVLRPQRTMEDMHLLRGYDLAIHDASNMVDETLHALISTASVVVDALLGTGLSEAPREDAARLIGAFEAAKGPILSLDLPSGVLADDGRVPGAAVHADATVTFGFPKLGALLHPGRAHTGRLIAVDIGFPPAPRAGWWRALTPAWASQNRPRRRAEAHKNSAGVVTVVAGREGMAGAALLASRSALRAGAGYLRLVAPPELRETVQSALPEVVFVDRTDAGAVEAAIQAAGALAIGPAMGTDPASAELLGRLLASGRPAVVDADALTILASHPDLLPEDRSGLVHTPHPGEAARVLGIDTAALQDDRLSALAQLRETLGGAVVLKGAPTLVSDGELRFVDTVGSSDLAVAGMGDTLTGATATFLSQGAAPAVAAGLALVGTARAAARADRGTGLQAADVAEQLPGALGEGRGEPRLRAPFVTFDLDPAR